MAAVLSIMALSINNRNEFFMTQKEQDGAPYDRPRRTDDS